MVSGLQTPTVRKLASSRKRKASEASITLCYASDDPIAVKVIDFCLSLGVFNPQPVAQPAKSRLYCEIEDAFRELKEIKEGKKPRKHLSELIDELRANQD